MKEQKSPDAVYDLKSVKLPRLSGTPLRLMAALLEGPLHRLLVPNLLRSAGVMRLRERAIDEEPTFYPLHFSSAPAKENEVVPQKEWPGTSPPHSGFHFSTVHDYAAAFREGAITPEETALRVLESIESSDAADPPLKAFIAVDREDVLRQAGEAAQRLKNGEALSVFDGVPVAIKDELDMTPYPTSVGTSFLGKIPATEDATVVARLRAAGAVLIGKTNMHEIGLGVTGSNPHHGTPRNPYDPARYTGGSSSGSAAAVAAGLCPVAIGADGGGSIRIPASFCGLVGLKSTFGRLSEFGAAPLDWSVAHLGPIAASATDAALAWAVMAGPDAKDPMSLHQPAPGLHGWDNLDLSDLTLGVFWPWFRHANKNVVATCEATLTKLKQMGAKVREVVIPDLEAGRIAHTVTITSEMAEEHNRYYEKHHRDYSFEVRISLGLARQFSARDYVQAQRIRTRMIAHFRAALQHVDAIITPSTGLTAPLIPQDALQNGESDLSTLTEIMRFATFANLTGLPAISFPAGYDHDGMPVGLQAISRPWQEPLLLRLALAAESTVERKKPQLNYNILPA